MSMESGGSAQKRAEQNKIGLAVLPDYGSGSCGRQDDAPPRTRRDGAVGIAVIEIDRPLDDRRLEGALLEARR